MGFYLRKSLKVGSIRFNLSKSGIGMSSGVRGFRVGTGPRGNYVHMGRGGVYYRASLNGSPRTGPGIPTAPPRLPASDGLQEIESGSVLGMVDGTSAALLAEMNDKSKRWRLWPWLAVAGVCLIGLANAIHPAAPLVLLVVWTPLVWWVAQRDALRLTTVMMYDLDEAAVGRFQTLHDAFELLVKAGRVGHIAAKGNIADGKRHAGASSLVRRQVVRPHKNPPSRVSTNIEVPAIPVGKQVLHFFPDRVLVVEPGAVGAVSYADLQISMSPSRFIEEEGVPSDATVVGQTWKYVNKKGGPDKRFKDNRQLPVALYEQILFASATGLNEVLQVSCSGVGGALETARRALAAGAAVLDAERSLVQEAGM
jgi:hypothetical protein